MYKIDSTKTELQNLVVMLNLASTGPTYTEADFEVVSVESHVPEQGEQFANNTKITLRGQGEFSDAEVSLLYRRLALGATTAGQPPRSTFSYDSNGQTPDDLRKIIAAELGLCCDPGDDYEGVTMQFRNAEPGTTMQLTIRPARDDQSFFFTGIHNVDVFCVNGANASD